MWYAHPRPNIYICVRIPKYEGSKNRGEGNFEQIMAKITSKFLKNKPQIQDAQRTPNLINKMHLDTS